MVGLGVKPMWGRVRTGGLEINEHPAENLEQLHLSAVGRYRAGVETELAMK